MKDLHDDINMFSPSNHLTGDQLLRYHRGLMLRKEQHDVEKHLVDCELCRDALSGVALMPDSKGIDRIRHDLRKIARPKRGIMFQVAWRNVIITILVLSLLILIALCYLYIISRTK